VGEQVIAQAVCELIVDAEGLPHCRAPVGVLLDVKLALFRRF